MLRLMLCFLLLFACGIAEEKSYVFKAKGEFAEELKQLLQKHAKEGEVQIIEGEDYHEEVYHEYNEDLSAHQSPINEKKSNDNINKGKNLYDKICYRCHGTNAQKSTYASARALNTLSSEQIHDAIVAYKRSVSYGGLSKIIMRQQALRLSQNDIEALTSYIVSISGQKIEIEKKELHSEEKQGVQGTYLK